MPNDNVEQEMKALGARFAALIAAANITEEEREAWLTMLSDMSLEQIGKLMEILSAKLPSEATEDFARFRTELAGIQTQHQARVDAARKKAGDALGDIEKQLE